MSGFAILHRTLLGHPAFRNDAEAMAFAWMVLRASWKPTRVRYKERTISLARGQLSVSQRDMASALDRDKAWIERLWKRLKSEAMIEVASEAGVAVITICNYDKFQDARGTGEAPDEALSEAGARQAQGTEQQDKQLEQETTSEAKASSDAPARPKPSDFPRPDFATPDDWRDFLANRRKKRTPNTASAHRKLLREVQEWSRETGWPPGEVFRACVEAGWAGIYDPRSVGNGTGNRNGAGSSFARPGSRSAEMDRAVRDLYARVS